MPQDWFTQNAPKPQTDWFAANAPKLLPAAPVETGGASGFAREFWHRTNPLEMVKGLVHAAGDVPGTVKGLIAADPAFLTQAKAAADKGDYATALRKVLSYASMGLGHELDTQADLLAQGRYAEGAGAMAGTAVSLAAPSAAGKLGGARIPALAAQADPAVAEAVAAGRTAGVLIDAATATGNKFVQFAQKTADESLIGSVVGGRARTAQQQGLATMGEQIASKAHPARVAPDVAGEAAQAGARGAVRKQTATAANAYDRLRAIEARPENLATIEPPPALGSAPRQPVQKVPMAVNLAPVKDAIRPVHAALAEQNRIVPLSSMTQEGKAFVTLDRLLNGPDVAPLSVADAALGNLKTLARSKNPDLRTVGQGIAAKAVQELHAAVGQAAERAGPEAVQALAEGREATIAKYAAADVLKKLEGANRSKTPVTAFNQLTQDADVNLGHLRDVLTQTPKTKPLIGRAVLDGIIDSPTATPGRSWTDWQKIGPETKALLYAPDHVKAIDDFLLLRKKIAENPNPSGSGVYAVKGGELAAVLTGHPVYTLTAPMISALLHSPDGVKILTQGFRLPSRSTIAGSAWLAQLAKVAAQAGAPLNQPLPGR